MLIINIYLSSNSIEALNHTQEYCTLISDYPLQQRNQPAPVPGLLQLPDGRGLWCQLRKAPLLGDLPGQAVLLPHTLRLCRSGWWSIRILSRNAADHSEIWSATFPDLNMLHQPLYPCAARPRLARRLPQGEVAGRLHRQSLPQVGNLLFIGVCKISSLTHLFLSRVTFSPYIMWKSLYVTRSTKLTQLAV